MCWKIVACTKREARTRMELSPTLLTSEPPMTLIVAQSRPALHDLFHDTAEQLAHDTGFCQRKRQLTGSTFAQTLVFTLLHQPHPSLQDFADFAAEHLHVHVSHNAFDQRF